MSDDIRFLQAYFAAQHSGALYTYAQPRLIAGSSWEVISVASDRPAIPGRGIQLVPVISGRAILPQGMPSIPAAAFADCDSLTSVVCPRSIQAVGDRAFFQCRSLTSVTFSHEGEGDRAFQCGWPIPVTFSHECELGRAFQCVARRFRPRREGFGVLNDAAFYACSSLQFVALPATLCTIGPGAFEGCTSLTHIALPAGVRHIGSDAFLSCRSLKRIVFSPALISIGQNAFRGCSSLDRVTVPLTAVFLHAFPVTTVVVRLPPESMRALQLWYDAIDAALAHKRCRHLLYGWLERAQLRLGSYGANGAARKRDREEFEGDFAHLL